MEAKSVKETKELLKGILELVKVSAEILKDGAQVSDLVAGYQKIESDPIKKQAIAAALAGISAVPAEIKDISLNEGIELTMVVVAELPSVIAAFKTPTV